MTDIELQEYNKLSITERDIYNRAMVQHPDWSHQQALTYTQIVKSAGDVVGGPRPGTGRDTGGGTGVDIREVLTDVMYKAEQFIRDRFPRIYSQVKQTFDKVISKVKSGLIKAWNEIMSWFV